MTAKEILKGITDLYSSSVTEGLVTEEFAYLWDILTALRGPDSENKVLKQLTIERIRSYIFPYMSRTIPLTKEEVVKRDNLLRGDSLHFSWHFFNALKALRELGFVVPDLEYKVEIPGLVVENEKD